jgi:hypothetical protein
MMQCHTELQELNISAAEEMRYWEKEHTKSGFSTAPHVDMSQIGTEVFRNKEPTHDLHKLRNQIRKILTRQDTKLLDFETFRGQLASTRVVTIDEKRKNSRLWRAKVSKLRIRYDRGDTQCRICQQNFVSGDRTRLLLATPPELMSASADVQQYQQCGHTFHDVCISACVNTRSKNPKCPVCRVAIDKSLLVGKSDGANEKERDKKSMALVLRVKAADIDKLIEDKRAEKNTAMEAKDYTRATAIHKEIAVLMHKQQERDDKEHDEEDRKAEEEEAEAESKLRKIQRKKEKEEKAALGSKKSHGK